MTIRHFLLAILTFVLSACGPSYRTDFPPPLDTQTYQEIVPGELGGASVVMTPLELDPAQYKGVEAKYGQGASLLLLQCKDQEALDTFVKETLVPELEAYSSQMSGKVNGQWSFKASGEMGRTQGWQNQHWFFVIRAANDDLFEEMVEKFSFIQKK